LPYQCHGLDVHRTLSFVLHEIVTGGSQWVGDIVYQTLVDVLSVPEHDRFHVITEHPRGGLPFDRDYLGIHRTDNCIFFQITLNSGRSVESKQNFYKALADRLNEGMKLRREDVLTISLKYQRRIGHLETEWLSISRRHTR
jgi:L-fucose isomerase-like protein